MTAPPPPARLHRSFRSLLPSTVTANGFFKPHSAVGQGPFPQRLKTTSRVRNLSYLPGTLPLPWVGLRWNLPTIQEEGPDDSGKELVSKTPAAGLPPGLPAEQEKGPYGSQGREGKEEPHSAPCRGPTRMSHVFNSPDFACKTDARKTTQRADRLGQRLVPREGQSIKALPWRCSLHPLRSCSFLTFPDNTATSGRLSILHVLFILSYIMILRGSVSDLIRFCSTRLFRTAFLLVEFIAPMFCDISPTCICLLSSSFLRLNRSNHSSQPGCAVFTLTTHPLTPAHTPPQSFLYHPTCSPPHPHSHTSSLLCTHTSSQSPQLCTFTPASTHYRLQIQLHTHQAPLLSMPSCLPTSFNSPHAVGAAWHIRMCPRHSRAAHRVPLISPKSSGISGSHHSWVFTT